MQNEYERRKYKRLPIELHLDVSKVFKQGNVILDHIDTGILVFDISKAGIGFTCTANLPLDYYFDGKIKLQEGAFFYAVIHIVRARMGAEGETIYGAEFVGLAPFLASKIDDYERTIEREAVDYY